MKIANANIQMYGEASVARVEAREERVKAWVGERPTDTPREDRVDLSNAALEWLRDSIPPPLGNNGPAPFGKPRPGLGLGAQAPTTTPGAKSAASILAETLDAAAKAAPSTKMGGGVDLLTDADEQEKWATRDPKLQLLVTLLEKMTGQKLELLDAEDFEVPEGQQALANEMGNRASAQQNGAAGGGAPRADVGWGLDVETTEVTATRESMQFRAEGVIETADGKRIGIEAELSMNRETVVVKNARLRAGDALKDPLVLNFGGTAAELTGKTKFDLDADGSEEGMAFVGPGSGFLVLGANGSSRPVDGRQLFGPKTGQGFAELARLDDDKNGFIDEGDRAFQSLGVWTQDAAGKESVRSLASVGVGAISVGSAATPWEHRDGAGNLTGKTTATGIFVSEAGGVGTVQQVDLVTRAPTSESAGATAAAPNAVSTSVAGARLTASTSTQVSATSAFTAAARTTTIAPPPQVNLAV